MSTDRRVPAVAARAQPSRAQRKRMLEERIEQQRVDILVEASHWHDASRPIEDGWKTLMRFKGPLYAIGGFVLLRKARGAGSLMQIARRLTSGVLLFRNVHRLLR
ncbi:YqjK family protein [Halomonas urumqiensis]|uniref:Cell division protein FtsH n=1 Tax=Halomonas urumqiensis TaxID=1684789 RepID=A0A2N7UF92_9GAMM|nr:YqjK family protein [Halomonas urumqiensis]PMR79138.1 hypothetical protein C1H70_12595 [Halomonas urumqiensis]PTB03813.1 hypothetical protein C6V82_04880 [Halomonas urumqiensis]GHE19954.1 hypothetical protein GCM10017767_04750 [Halomonas urumqiensis]